MADIDFVVNTGIRTVGNSFSANTSGILLNTNVTFSNTITLIANGVAPTANQVLGANSSGSLYWKTLPNPVPTNLPYAFANTVTFRGTVVFANSVSTNGGFGTSGQVFLYNGSNSYWGTAVNLISANGAVIKSGTDRNLVLSVDAISPSPNGQYGLPAITVDSYGRITAAAIAGAGGVQTVSAANQQVLSVTSTSGNNSVGYNGDITVNLANAYPLGSTQTFTSIGITLDSSGKVIAGTNTATANVTFSNNYITAPALKAFSEFVSNVAASTSTTTLDLSTSNFFNLTVSANTTLAFINPPSGRVFSFTVVITQDATGGRTIGLPSTSKYPNGQTPTKSTVANSTDIWTFTTYDGGTTYIASLTLANLRAVL